MTTSTLTFSNPRHLAEFSDWPSGSLRVQCRFSVEHHPKRGWRVLRATTDKHGRWCKPKTTTYSGPLAIVDGSDGRTYVLQVAQHYGFISIWESTLATNHTVHASSEPERHAELLTLISAVPLA